MSFSNKLTVPYSIRFRYLRALFPPLRRPPAGTKFRTANPHTPRLGYQASEAAWLLQYEVGAHGPQAASMRGTGSGLDRDILAF